MKNSGELNQAGDLLSGEKRFDRTDPLSGNLLGGAGCALQCASPGGIYVDQDDAFIQRLSQLIPMGRMAHRDEYKAAVAFLVSDASSYMNGTNLVMDGGRSVW